MERAPIAILGAAGRMGQALRVALEESPDFILGFAADRSGDPMTRDARAGATDLSGLVPGDVVGILEFSSPQGTVHAAESALRLRCPLVTGTTGLGAEARAALAEAARQTAVCWSPNFSIGIPVLLALLKRAATLLPSAWQIEILEMHHQGKKDAPSGTALRLADAWREVRGGETVLGRSGASLTRTPDEVGIAALRLGSVAGEHRILLAGPGELVELRHSAGERSSFATGAIEALRRLRRQGPGTYEWSDLLLGAKPDSVRTTCGEPRPPC